MKKILIPSLILIIVSCSTPEKDKSRVDVFKEINKEVQANSKAYATLKESTETTGHRLTGSKTEPKQKNTPLICLNRTDLMM